MSGHWHAGQWHYNDYHCNVIEQDRNRRETIMSKRNDNPSTWPEWAEVADTMESIVAAIRARIAAPQATLPDDNEQRTVATMRVGESRWFSDDTVWADADKRMWLHASAPGYPEAKRGHYRIKVERLADGYLAWLPVGKEYMPGREGYIGVLYGKADPIPVTHVRRSNFAKP